MGKLVNPKGTMNNKAMVPNNFNAWANALPTQGSP